MSLIFSLMFGFSQCASTQKLEKEAPMQFDQVSSQKWTGGQPGSSGLNIYIKASGDMKDNMQMDSVYFRGRATKLVLKEGQYVGSFNDPVKPDIVMSSNVKEEAGNRPPTLLPKIPFELANDECVISYTQDGKKKYYKISQVKEKQPLIYPSAKPRQ